MFAQAFGDFKNIINFHNVNYSQYVLCVSASAVEIFIHPDCKVSNNSLPITTGIALTNLVMPDFSS